MVDQTVDHADRHLGSCGHEPLEHNRPESLVRALVVPEQVLDGLACRIDLDVAGVRPEHEEETDQVTFGREPKLALTVDLEVRSDETEPALRVRTSTGECGLRRLDPCTAICVVAELHGRSTRRRRNLRERVQDRLGSQRRPGGRGVDDVTEDRRAAQAALLDLRSHPVGDVDRRNRVIFGDVLVDGYDLARAEVEVTAVQVEEARLATRVAQLPDDPLEYGRELAKRRRPRHVGGCVLDEREVGVMGQDEVVHQADARDRARRAQRRRYGAVIAPGVPTHQLVEAWPKAVPLRGHARAHVGDRAVLGAQAIGKVAEAAAALDVRAREQLGHPARAVSLTRSAFSARAR